jgi:hypothetical protein
MKTLSLILLLAGVCGCVSVQEPAVSKPVEPASADPNSASTPRRSTLRDLTFLGTVTNIEAADTGNPRKEWVVTTRVDKVLSGDFSGSQFSFAIHSPAKSGLEVGKQYRIRAAGTPDGYIVDGSPW